MMYSILKLYIQNNLSSTIKYENKCFFFYIYSKSRIEYRIKKMKSGYTTFETKQGLKFIILSWSMQNYSNSNLIEPDIGEANTQIHTHEMLNLDYNQFATLTH